MFRDLVPSTLLLGSMLFLAVATWAQDGAAGSSVPEFSTYVLKSGKSLEAQVLGIEGDTVKLLAREGGAQAEVKLELSKFTGISQFNMRRSQIADTDLEGHLQLADWTIGEGLFTQTRQQLRGAVQYAKDAELAEADRAALRDRMLGLVEKALVALVERGKVHEARADVRRLLLKHDETISEEWRERLHDAVENTVAKQQAADREAEANEAASAAQKNFDKLFQKIEQLAKRGQDLRRQAMTKAKTTGQQQRLLDQAVKAFEQANVEVQKLRKEGANDDAVQKELDRRVEEGVNWWKDAVLGSASIDVTRGSFNQATAKVNKVLALSPQDDQALRMRARIEIAANEWGDWR